MNNYTSVPAPESSPSPSWSSIFGGTALAIGLLLLAIWLVERMSGKK